MFDAPSGSALCPSVLAPSPKSQTRSPYAPADSETELAEISSTDDIIGRLKRLTILGSTGSIGVSTLDVVGQHPERYAIHALVAGHNVDLLARQIQRFRPDRVATATEETRESLRKCLADSGLARREWP